MGASCPVGQDASRIRRARYVDPPPKSNSLDMTRTSSAAVLFLLSGDRTDCELCMICEWDRGSERESSTSSEIILDVHADMERNQ